MREDLEGSGLGLMEVLSRNLLGGPEENYVIIRIAGVWAEIRTE
jgi:hypothetical protein